MFTDTIEIKRGKYWMKYSDVILIDSLESYQEYYENFKNKFTIAESEIKTLKNFSGHGHSTLAQIVSCLHEDKSDREPMLFHLKKLQGTLLANQVKDILNGNKLVINKHGGYTIIFKDDEYRILETDEKKYTRKDIKINKWFGGKHFYAKISEIDVVDEFGNVKWNTEEDATKAAEKYIKKLNGRK